MGQFVISEQDIVNALCMDVSRKHNVQPEEVTVELIYDDEAQPPFSAEATIDRLTFDVQMSDIIAALRLWIDDILNEDPYAGIQLKLDDDEGVIAVVHS
ncbi:MAG TPA: DUF2653 family protein [Bacillota bacterium]